MVRWIRLEFSKMTMITCAIRLKKDESYRRKSKNAIKESFCLSRMIKAQTSEETIDQTAFEKKLEQNAQSSFSFYNTSCNDCLISCFSYSVLPIKLWAKNKEKGRKRASLHNFLPKHSKELISQPILTSDPVGGCKCYGKGPYLSIPHLSLFLFFWVI